MTDQGIGFQPDWSLTQANNNNDILQIKDKLFTQSQNLLLQNFKYFQTFSNFPLFIYIFQKSI